MPYLRGTNYIYALGLNLISRFVLQVNRLTKCDICVVLKEEKLKTMDKNSRNYYDLLYSQHNELQR